MRAIQYFLRSHGGTKSCSSDFGTWNAIAQVWFEAGATKFEFADAVTLAIVQSFLMGFAESKRYNDFINPGSQGEPGSFAGFEAGLGGTGVNGYPGASFDPFGYSKDPKMLETMKLKEIKNGAFPLPLLSLGASCSHLVCSFG